MTAGNTATKRTRPRGFALWTPRPDSLALVVNVQMVLAEYQSHLPLTCRQIFYRLVAMKGFDKTEAAYSRLTETIGRARRAGLVHCASIRDDGNARYEWPSWADPAQYLMMVRDDAQGFMLDRQEGQETRLWLLCEAGGMAPMLARVANPFGVPVLSSGGFDSLTAKHELAHELARNMREGTTAEVLHIGDLDPYGVHLFSSMTEDVCAMTRQLANLEPRFTRLAVTPEQALHLGLPGAPAKVTDRRKFTGETVQCEAIAPDVLSEIVRVAIEGRRDPSGTDVTLELEGQMRAELLAKLGALQ